MRKLFLRSWIPWGSAIVYAYLFLAGLTAKGLELAAAPVVVSLGIAVGWVCLPRAVAARSSAQGGAAPFWTRTSWRWVGLAAVVLLAGWWSLRWGDPGSA